MKPIDIINFFTKIVEITTWPGILLIFILLFEQNLRNLMDRIRSFKYQGVEVDFSSDEKKPKQITKLITSQAIPLIALKPSIDKPATLFWLANDLMWLQDMLYRDAPCWSIIKGLENLQKYTTALGFKDSYADIELSRLITDTQTTLDSGISSWSPEYKMSLVRRIQSIKWFLADSIQNEYEKGFKKYRVFPA